MRLANSNPAARPTKLLAAAPRLPRVARDRGSTCSPSKVLNKLKQGKPGSRFPIRSKHLGDCRDRLDRGNVEREERRMASYLTLEDERNFGPELLDVATRAARHALAPELQRLHEENQELQDQLTSATKTTIDQYLDANVPNWRQINADERFHQWLLMPDPYSGIVRDRLLKDAAHAANAQRVASFFKGFLAAAGQASASTGQAPQRTQRVPRTPSGQRIYDRSEITEMAARRRKGLINDADWQRWEYELCRASAEGRVRGALGVDGVPISR